MKNDNGQKFIKGRPNKVLSALISLGIVCAIAVGTVAITNLSGFNSPTNVGDDNSTVSTESSAPKTHTATVAATGDLLIHEAVFKAAEQDDGSYNFDSMFQYLKAYVSKADYAVANLETTLAGTQLGYKYTGYPCFNTPDAIAEAAKNAGFDMLLTANNHAYDTRFKGMQRTAETVSNLGLDRIGTNLNSNEKKYVVKEINNIKIGMVCYTYETDRKEDSVALNGIPLTQEAAGLVNAFSHGELDAFYSKMERHIADMKADGAEAIMLFIHWGEEYHLKENNNQRKIAQKMCDLGVDVIVGGHPHVIQPMDILTSTTDATHKTVCAYSLGNTLSNMPGSWGGLADGYALDGALFNVTFFKDLDGTVSVQSADVLPLYCNVYTSVKTGKKNYEIIPLDEAVSDWQTSFNLADSTLKKCQSSIERTEKTIGEGLKKVNAVLSGKDPEEALTDTSK